MWMSLFLVAMLNADAGSGEIRGSTPRDDFSQDFDWALGISGSLVSPQSGDGLSLSPALGLGFSLARGVQSHMAWHIAFERSAHTLLGGGSKFEQGTGNPISDSAVEGTSRQIWSRLGLRWSPRISGNDAARVTGVLGWGVGAVHERSTLDLAAPDGSSRISATNLLPSVQTELGLEFILEEWLVIHIGSQAGLVLGFDASEIGGGGRVTVWRRITPAVEILGRF